MTHVSFLVRAGGAIVDPSAPDGVQGEMALLVEKGRIAAIAPFAELASSRPDVPVVGNEDAIALPGLINAHDHGRGLSPLSLGIRDDLLEVWILRLMRMPALNLRQDTALSALRQAQTGISTTVNSYFDPRNDRAAFDAVIDGYAEAGIRAGLVYSAMDKSVVSRLLREAAARLDETDRALVEGFTAKRSSFEIAPYLAMLETYADLGTARNMRGRTFLMTGPVSAHWSSDEQLGTIRQAAARFGLSLQMHLLESPFQARDNGAFSEGSVIRHLAGLGLLDRHVSCAHCVQVDADDLAVLAETGASVVHNVSSNIRLKNGRAPVSAMLRAGVNVALGLDSAGINDDTDMFQEMRLAFRVHGDLTAGDVLAMATVNGAKALGLSDEIGTLEVGKRADILLLDGKKMPVPRSEDPARLAEYLINYACPSAVSDLFVDGAAVVRQGRHVSLQEDKLAAELFDAAAAWRMDPAAQAMLEIVTPVLRQLLQEEPADD